MSTIISAIKTFVADEEGVTAIEYGLIAALVGVAMAAAATTLGTNLDTLFTDIAGRLVEAGDEGAGEGAGAGGTD